MTRLFGVLVAAVALLSVAWSADAAAPSSGAAAGPIGAPVMSTQSYTTISDVLVVGDSITVRGYKELAAALPGRRLAVNAQSGRNTALSIDALFRQMQAGVKLPPVLVMAVGANDIFSSGVMAGQVKRLLAGVPASTKVFWVDVSVLRPAYKLADGFNSARVNQSIRAYCTGKCTVISWAGFLAVNGRGKLIDSGGVHQTPAGAKAWGKLIAGPVKGALAS